MKKTITLLLAISFISIFIGCKKNHTDEPTEEVFSNTLSEEDNDFIDSISVANPSLDEMFGYEGNPLRRATKDLVKILLTDAQSLSGQKIITYPSEGTNKPEHMGLVYSSGQRNINQRLNPLAGNDIHKQYAVYGTDCSGLQIILLRDAGINIRNTDVAGFEQALDDALKSSDESKNLSLKNLHHISANETKSGDYIRWLSPGLNHIGIIADLGNLGKIVFQSNGTSTPADENAQAKNLSLTRGVHPISLTMATTGTGYWGTGYEILRFSDTSTDKYNGLTASSGLVYFGDQGPPNCQYSVEYTNTYFSLEVDKDSKSISSATVNTKMTEALTSQCIHGVTPPHINIYSFKDGSINGDNVQISYNDNSKNYPPNNTTFSGKISGNKLTGTLTLVRTSYPPCTVTIPINATLQ